MQEYTVKIEDGITRWYKPGTNELHRLDGPAIEYANGYKYWYIEDVKYTEAEFNAKVSPKAIVKELTLAEISELLGYEVKVVK